MSRKCTVDCQCRRHRKCGVGCRCKRHSWAVPEPERFWTKVDFAGLVPDRRPELGPCWYWVGALFHGTGYGEFRSKGGYIGSAHRYAYEFCVGPIPKGLTLDHLCRVRRCINPGHLEAVSLRTNILRGNNIAARYAARTHCGEGHKFTYDNIYWKKGTTGKKYRACRTCILTRQRKPVRTRSMPEDTAANELALDAVFDECVP